MRGRLAAQDVASDLTIIRLEGIRALPYVARLARIEKKLLPHSQATSIGIDLGITLAGWSSRIMDNLTFELNQRNEPRSFLITDNVPEHGRSGGGLFLESGELAGVCIGHTEMRHGRRMGVFASRASIQMLLEDHNLTAVIRRSELDPGRSRPTLARSSQQQQKKTDRQEAEDRKTSWPGIEKKDERKEQAQHEPGHEHQTRAAGVNQPVFRRVGGREFSRSAGG